MMVVSFRFFLTLNSDDGSKPTPTMETQPVFDGDGKLCYYFWLTFLHPFSGLSFGCLLKLYYYFFFLNFNFSQFKLGCFNLLKNANPPRNWYTLQFWKGPLFLPSFLPGCWYPIITEPGWTLQAAKTKEPWLRKTVRPALSRQETNQHWQVPALGPA